MVNGKCHVWPDDRGRIAEDPVEDIESPWMGIHLQPNTRHSNNVTDIMQPSTNSIAPSMTDLELVNTSRPGCPPLSHSMQAGEVPEAALAPALVALLT